MRCIAWLWSLTEKKGKIRFITALAISAFTSVLLLVNPTLSAKLVDDVIVAQNPEPLLGILAVMLAVKLGREGLRYAMVIMLEKTSQENVLKLRRRLFRACCSTRTPAYFDRNRTGELMTRMSGDLDWCRHFMSYIALCHRGLLVCIFLSTLICFFFTSWRLTLFLVMVTPLLLLITKLYSRQGPARCLCSCGKRSSEMNAAAQENIAGNRVVKAFAREELRRRKIRKAQRRLPGQPARTSTRSGSAFYPVYRNSGPCHDHHHGISWAAT